MSKVRRESGLDVCLHMQKQEARSAAEVCRNLVFERLDLLGTDRRRTILEPGGP